MVTGLWPLIGNPYVRWERNLIYFGGRLLATNQRAENGETVAFHHPDRLGTRLVTNATGAAIGRQTTLPFGTLLEAPSTPGTPPRFTSYDRSTATGLDYALSRIYAPQQGRFMQPDPLGLAGGRLDDPQSLNVYAYVRNDPVNISDALGLVPCGLLPGDTWGFGGCIPGPATRELANPAGLRDYSPSGTGWGESRIPGWGGSEGVGIGPNARRNIDTGGACGFNESSNESAFAWYEANFLYESNINWNSGTPSWYNSDLDLEFVMLWMAPNAFGVPLSPVVSGFTRFEHWWIQTPDYVFGLGGAPLSMKSPVTEILQTQVTDHRNYHLDRPNSYYYLIFGPRGFTARINEQFVEGRRLGRYSPSNTCQTFAIGVLKKAGALNIPEPFSPRP